MKFPLQLFDPLSGKCGKPIKHLSGTLYYSCVLERCHPGDCKRGGTCQEHGPYIGEQCPEWPDCIRNFNR